MCRISWREKKPKSKEREGKKMGAGRRKRAGRAGGGKDWGRGKVREGRTRKRGKSGFAKPSLMT